MAKIIAGRFQTFEQTERATQSLRERALGEADVSVFYVNPPGQHAATPIGGDHVDADPDAREADSGAMKGAAAGGAVGIGVGLAAAPLIGPVAAIAGAGVGAYTASLGGALASTGSATSHPVPRRAGVMLAVHAEASASAADIIVALRRCGAEDIEIAEGTWANGSWTDFDPTKSPQLLSQEELAALPDETDGDLRACSGLSS